MKQNPIIYSLCQAANKTLSKAIPKMRSAVPLVALNLKPFVVGSLGLFPYYWKDPNTQTVNLKTYNWIKTNIEAQSNPYAQASGSTFPNLFIDAFSKISYCLSKADRDELTKASENIWKEEKELINIWTLVYGAIQPEKGKAIIDMIIDIIVSTWKSTVTTLAKLQLSSNLNSFLDKTPASGLPILPILLNYINALNRSVSLQNATSLSTGYLKNALAAVQSPNSNNGGIQLNDNSIQPAYVINTPLQKILDGLKDTSKSITITATASYIDDNEISFKIPNNAPFEIHPHDFLKMTVKSDPNYFIKLLKQSNTPIKIDLSFRGVTMVYFQPVAFSKSQNKNWYWSEPIVEAIRNGNSDVSGFKFLPTPSIDFSEDGPFGFLTGVAISNFPKIDLQLNSSAHKDIVAIVQDSTTIDIELLGNAVESVSSEPNMKKSSNTDSSTNFVTVSLEAQETLFPNLESRAWVHGVQVIYPATMAKK